MTIRQVGGYALAWLPWLCMLVFALSVSGHITSLRKSQVSTTRQINALTQQVESLVR